MTWPIALHLEGYVYITSPVALVSGYHLTNIIVRYDPLSTQGDHFMACVSLSHPLLNLQKVFSRLWGRLEAETWLGLGLVVKNHILSTAPQNLKAGVSANISANVWGNCCEGPCQHLYQAVLDSSLQSQQSQSYIIAPIVFAQTSRWGLELRMNAFSNTKTSMRIMGALKKYHQYLSCQFIKSKGLFIS